MASNSPRYSNSKLILSSNPPGCTAAGQHSLSITIFQTDCLFKEGSMTTKGTHWSNTVVYYLWGLGSTRDNQNYLSFFHTHTLTCLFACLRVTCMAGENTVTFTNQIPLRFRSHVGNRFSILIKDPVVLLTNNPGVKNLVTVPLKVLPFFYP